MKPEQIEQKSFSIIDEEAGRHGFPPDQWTIVRRMIHTSADFEYIDSIRFHPGAIQAGINAIRKGRRIYTDTNMLRTGVRQRDLDRFGGTVTCLMADPDVARMAVKSGETRARVAVAAAVDEMAGGIYAVGNAPTALLRLIELIDAGNAAPALVIGLPVGFVNAAESKAALLGADVPYITNVGRKGGSNVAASVVNALILLAMEAE
ncbi:MAG: precorrin-8X methylmutase [Deltaproteobacteria bacterium]|nr:MAG: precorrin-8X methylmutase [Deltaproteobacteria bacterium]RUA03176.1 MAG: precorrin-8X methylmutase [Deltaproteobacteria bacterium]